MSPSKLPKREDAAKQKKELPAEGGHPSAKGQEYHTNMPVGEVLRRAREHFGQSLADVESAIRIRAIQIDAIEQGHYEKLPGRVYAIGFVRSYSEYLGFDGDKMVALFKSQSAGGGSVKPELNFPAPASESRVPSVGLIVVGLVLFGAFMAFWSSGNNVDTQDVADIPPVSSPETADSDAAASPAPASAPTENAAAPSVSSPAVATATVGGQDAAAAPSVAAASATPAASSAIPLKAGVSPDAAQTFATPAAVTAPDALAAPEEGDSTPEEESQSVGAQAVSGAVTSPEGTAPAPAATQAEMGATTTPASSEQGAAAAASAEVVPPQEGITLNVKESSWVEIKDESGKAIVSRMLKTGDQYFVPNRPDLKMSLGNAGGIEVTMDGKALPPFGKKGEVRRNIPLDITILKSLAAGHE